jgi:hypothetical protein
VQDVTQMRASGQHKVNDVVLAVLETLYTAMGFRFATVVLKDVRQRPVPRPRVLRRGQIRDPGRVRVPCRAAGPAAADRATCSTWRWRTTPT